MLVVDDNDTNRRILRSAAESWGMVVVDRARAAEALEVLDAETFDIAVLDFLMPEMDGIELAAAIRARPVRGDRRLPMLLRFCEPLKLAQLMPA